MGIIDIRSGAVNKGLNTVFPHITPAGINISHSFQMRGLFEGGPYMRKYGRHSMIKRGSQNGNQRGVDETHQCSFPSALFGSLFPQLVQINGESSLKSCLMS